MLRPTFQSKLNLVFENSDFLIINKPFGYRVHRVNPKQWGLLETLEQFKNCKLWPVHRLDKETSGLLIFAKSKEASQIFFDLFEKNLVKKNYVFLTDRTIQREQFTHESFIEKFDSIFVSKNSEPPNSKTIFKKISSDGGITLWQAQPQSGKPHQIRLHAKDNGISILGDVVYSGAEHFRMALHAITLNFTFKNENFEFETTLPLSFKLYNSSIESLLVSTKENIAEWIDQKSTNCYQLARKTNRLWTIDLLDKVYWIKNYGDDLSEQEKSELVAFAQKNGDSVFVRAMKDRGSGVGGEEQNLLFSTNSELATWDVVENKVKFKLRSDSGFSTGLFLDQRENRRWVSHSSSGKAVLNLFAYTCAFSVCAALGQADCVTSVDASKPFLDWGRANFLLNDLNPEKHEFFHQDCLLFLEGAKKRSRRWDLIVCDPPTFGRSKNSIWKIEKDFPQLLQLMWSSLNSGGQILFTCNYEKWTPTDLVKKIKMTLKNEPLEFLDLPIPPLDFGCYDELESATKGVIICKP
jgi:23S rRNA (cytosine1962-C5)-methyltransferase